MEMVVGVRFRNVGKIYYFNPKNYKVKVGDHVIVEMCIRDRDNNTPGGGTSDNGGTTGRTSVKTGDDTPIGVWVGILAAAVVIGGAAGIAVKRKKKK